MRWQQAVLEPAGSGRKFVVALARGLEVLRAFRPDDGLLGNQEIARRTGLPKPTVSRLTYTLTSLGYLDHLEKFGKYQLAPAALALGYAALAHMGIRQVARPLMQELADYAGASVAMGSRDRLSVIYVEHTYSHAALMVRLDTGSRIPIASSAMGRALISLLPQDAREALFAELAERMGERWPATRAGIDRAAEEIAERGFAMSAGDWRPDINGVGVPLAAPDGSGLFALNCGAAAFGLSRDRLERDIGPRLVEVARRIHSTLGGGDTQPQAHNNQSRGGYSGRSSLDDGSSGDGTGGVRGNGAYELDAWKS